MTITLDDLRAYAELIKSTKPSIDRLDSMWEEFPTLQSMHPEMKNSTVHQAIDKMLNEGNEHTEPSEALEYRCIHCENWHEDKYAALHCCSPEVVEERYTCHCCGEGYIRESNAISCCEHWIETRRGVTDETL